jgi:hypothetical protein
VTRANKGISLQPFEGGARVQAALASICAAVVKHMRPLAPEQQQSQQVVSHFSLQQLQQQPGSPLQLCSGCRTPPVVVVTVAGPLGTAAAQAGPAVAEALALGRPVARADHCLRLMFTAGSQAAATPALLLGAVQKMAGELGRDGGSTCVAAACTGGGLVAWCQKGYGAWLPPPAAGAPQLEGVQPCIVAVAASGAGGGGGGSGSCSSPLLGLRGSGLAGRQLLVQQGTQLHVARLGEVPDPGLCGGSLEAPVPAEALRIEGLLSVAVAADEFFVSAAYPVLVLDADKGVVDALNEM